jgi:Fe-S-cluster containining protein
MSPDNPCLRHGCFHCCIGTAMTLTAADVERLEALGHSSFYRITEAGDLQLLNRSGSCIFLRQGRCSVYEHRPEGCEIYPLIFDRSTDRVIPDTFCPHSDEFPFSGELEQRLRRSIADEEREAEQRRRGRDLVPGSG